ncbi:hypothetical protein HXZ94_07340 [Empedobacter falsenii]|uniref:hypothetical protein n=1 Tax=Empedobacter falsenii TaxID=343874 RepID=UPI002576BDCF|nr:hypothetical protein [Empedobacter falsenii]MDM1298314.1 hypothetical protein [Empedobacter falsenii]MDM1318129.1 hypothetical protein [Empedobacter falsenii]
MKTQLKFNYHDAILETLKFQQNTLEMDISLYSVFYPTRPKVKFVVENITNSITCEKWIREVTTAYYEENEDTLGARINSIDFDENNAHQILISVDSVKTLKLKFNNVKEILI